MNLSSNPLFTKDKINNVPLSTLYPSTFNLLTLRHLGSLPLSGTQLQALVLPALRTNLVQRLLALPMRRRTFLTSTLPRLDRLDQSGVVTVQRITFQIILVIFLREDVRAEFRVFPPSSFTSGQLILIHIVVVDQGQPDVPWKRLLSSQSSVT